MKAIYTKLESKSNIRIIPFSDLHIGSDKFNEDLFKAMIADVSSNKNTYAIICGDLINNATKNSVSDIYSSTMCPQQQIEYAVELFRPIAHKILAVTAGNHDMRTWKSDGCDLVKFFCMTLGIEDKYDPIAFVLNVNLSGIGYAIYGTHGNGQGGRTMGGKANGLERRASVVPNADVIVTGHTHQAMAFKQACYILDEMGTPHFHEQTFVNCGSTLDYEAYAEQFGFKPSSLAQPIICLDARGMNVTVEV